MSAVDVLALVRKAWADHERAAAEVARLRTYRSLTPGMKDDRQRWLRLMTDSRAVLVKHLGGGR